MKMQRCSMGHLYNAEHFASCPHCAANDKTSAARVGVRSPAPNAVSENESIPSELSVPKQHPAQKKRRRLPTFTIERAAKTVADVADEDNEKTRGFRYTDDEGDAAAGKPVVGFLLCTRGKYYGQAFPLYDGRNTIGRGSDAVVSLAKETSVSRRPQAIVAYDPKENTFFAVPGASSELCYLNGNALLESSPLAKNDRIAVGKVTLMFLPCCDDAFSWLKE